MTTQGIPIAVTAHYEALFEAESIGIGFLDADLRILRVNDTLAAINGLRPSEHLGRTVRDIIPGTGLEVERVLRRALDQRAAATGLEFVGETADRPGVVRRFIVDIEPVLSAAGEVLGLVGLVQEVSAEASTAMILVQRESQLSLAMELAQLGTWEWDAGSGLVNWSPQLERLYGLEPGTFPGTFDAYVALIHPEDRAGVVARTEQSRAAAALDHRVEHRVVMANGEIRWIEGRGSRVLDGQGRVAGMAGISLDVTERKLAEQHLIQENQVVEALYQMSCELGGERSVAALLDKVTAAATRLTGATFGAFFYNEPVLTGDSRQLFALVGADREQFESFPMPSNTKVLAPTFLGAGPLRYADVTTEPGYGHNPPSQGTPAGHLDVRSYLAVPVAGGGGEVLGGLLFGHPEPGRFDDTAERVAVGIAAQAAIALENARLHDAAKREIAARQRAFEERDQVARQLQRSLLPPHLPAVPGVELAARFLPLTEGVGGDFYDVFQLRGKGWAATMGDVCGKGPEAAAVTALTRYTLRAAAMTESKPTKVLALLNRVLLSDPDPDNEIRFCTVVFSRIVPTASGVRLRACLAGHPPMLVLRANGALEPHGLSGTVLGAFPEVELREFAVDLRPGDICLLYTDGATDIRNRGVHFGEERLAEVVRGCRGLRPAELVEHVESAVLDFQQGNVEDDLALLAIGVPLPPERRPVRSAKGAQGTSAS
jgi:PAS domain S-box-containing protein